MHDKAALAFLADFLDGKDSILLAGSNDEAADLARRVQDRLIRAGRVQQPQVQLADDNRAGIGPRSPSGLDTASKCSPVYMPGA
jgi:hypothetical protein